MKIVFLVLDVFMLVHAKRISADPDEDSGDFLSKLLENNNSKHHRGSRLTKKSGKLSTQDLAPREKEMMKRSHFKKSEESESERGETGKSSKKKAKTRSEEKDSGGEDDEEDDDDEDDEERARRELEKSAAEELAVEKVKEMLKKKKDVEDEAEEVAKKALAKIDKAQKDAEARASDVISGLASAKELPAGLAGLTAAAPQMKAASAAADVTEDAANKLAGILGGGKEKKRLPIPNPFAALGA